MSVGRPFGTDAPGPLVRLILSLSQNTVLGRGKARKIMAGLVRRFSSDMLDARLFDQNVRLHLHNNSSEIKALMKPSRYARTEIDFCAKFLQAADSVFVDIGANAGIFSLGVLARMPGGTLIAAEPQAVLFERLKANLETLNPDRSKALTLHIVQTAIGAHQGELSLSVPDQLGQASAHVLPGAASVKVPVTPLDDLASALKVQRIDMLKIDVEGFEDEVILPFLKTAPEHLWPRGIVMEHCHSDRWQFDCQAVLLEAGYKLVEKDRTNLMFARGVD